MKLETAKEFEKQHTKDMQIGCGIMLLLAICFISFLVYIVTKHDQDMILNRNPANWTFVSETTQEVERIFMHHTNKYSFLVRQGDKLENRTFVDDCPQRTIYYEILDDVPQDKKAYIVIKKHLNYFKEQSTLIVIHIHNATDIDGGEWKQRHGKHTTTGNTSILE